MMGRIQCKGCGLWSERGPAEKCFEWPDRCVGCGGPLTDASKVMILCGGCGLWVERGQVVEKDNSGWDTCIRCVACHDDPRARATYRRGFNDGLDAADRALHRAVTKSNLRMCEEK